MSEITLQVDFEKALGIAYKYAHDSEIPTCIVHHIKEDVSFEELKFQVEKCRANFIKAEELEEYIQNLARLGAIYAYLDGTYILTRLGDQLVKILDKEKDFDHPLRT